MQPRHSRTPIRRGLSRGLGRGMVAAAAVAMAAVSVLGTATVAGAADNSSGTGTGSGTGRHQHPQLTDTQKQCLSDALSAAGITLPQKPADGSRPQLTQEQRDAMKAAMKTAAEQCGLPARGQGGQGGPGGPGGDRPHLTDTQKQCLSGALSAAGITLPQKPADGTEPTEGSRPQLTQEQRDAMKTAMKAAAEQCGLPARPARGQQAGQNV